MISQCKHIAVQEQWVVAEVVAKVSDAQRACETNCVRRSSSIAVAEMIHSVGQEEQSIVVIATVHSHAALYVKDRRELLGFMLLLLPL